LQSYNFGAVKPDPMQAPKIKHEALQPDCFYHVYNRANGKEKLFVCNQNYHFFLKQYSLFIGPIADTFCYCLMPNHFHFLIRIKSEFTLAAYFEGMERLRMLKKIKDAGYDERFIPESKRGPEGFTSTQIQTLISKEFGNFFGSYSLAFNKTHNRMGSMFMKNFKRKRVTSELYLKTLVHYIHLNPVVSSFCRHPHEWPFSSYNALITNDSSIVKGDEVIDWFEDLSNFESTHTNFPELADC
jgi:putative transposase